MPGRSSTTTTGTTTDQATGPTESLAPLHRTRFDYWAAHHLLSRAGFGGTPDQVRALANRGLEDAVDSLVEYREVGQEPVSADEFDPDIVKPLTPAERRARRRARRSGDEEAVERFRMERQKQQRSDRQQMRSFQRWWLERIIKSPRPLEEKMTLFWHGHFATSYRAIEDSYHMFLQNQLFRSHAVGDFRALVHGIIHDPAMLRYLNNDQNRRQRPNENLARELMELFTLGEGHGYTEDDIKEGARALTGYAFNDDAFVFRPRLHDPEEKRILGQTGTWDGDAFVDIIFTKRFVSEFICLKLYRFFVNDLPAGPDRSTERFIVKLARTFRRSGYDVKTLLKTLFRSEHFYHERNVSAVIKSPIQLVVQTIRSLRTPTRDLNVLLTATDLMGQNVGFPPSVKGWDGGRLWINTSTLFVRQNLIVYLLTGRLREGRRRRRDRAPYDASHLVEHLETAAGGAGVEPREAVLHLLRFTLGTEPHPRRVETITRFVETAGGRLDNDVLIGVLSLIGAMPEFQLC